MLPGLGILQTSALRSGVFSWGFPAAASQVFGIKVGSGETADISCREGSGCSFGGVRALWDGVIRSSTLVIFGLGDLEPIAWLSLCLSFSFLSLSLWLVFQTMMSLMERVTVEMRDCHLWWQLGWWLLAWLVCVCNWGPLWHLGLADCGRCGVTLDK